LEDWGAVADEAIGPAHFGVSRGDLFLHLDLLLVHHYGAGVGGRGTEHDLDSLEGGREGEFVGVGVVALVKFADQGQEALDLVRVREIMKGDAQAVEIPVTVVVVEAKFADDFLNAVGVGNLPAVIVPVIF